MNSIKVVQFGLGPIGLETVRLLLEKKGVELVGAIDTDPGKAGKSIRDLLSSDDAPDFLVSPDAESCLARIQPDMIVHSTNSFLDVIESQLVHCIQSGASVVSSSEELFYPYRRDPGFCKRIDELCRQYDSTVVATGVNPGFSMDLLPVVMSSVCTGVNTVRAERIVDAGRRRRPLQMKVGAGLEPEVFKQRVQAGQLGHIGLIESLYAVADKLHIELENTTETIDPKIAPADLETEYVGIKQGQAAGILHRAAGFFGGVQKIYLELQMFVGPEQEYDAVAIDGTPVIDMKVAGGIFGDAATIARLVNAIPVVHEAPAGLLDVFRIPAISYWP